MVHFMMWPVLRSGVGGKRRIFVDKLYLCHQTYGETQNLSSLLSHRLRHAHSCSINRQNVQVVPPIQGRLKLASKHSDVAHYRFHHIRHSASGRNLQDGWRSTSLAGVELGRGGWTSHGWCLGANSPSPGWSVNTWRHSCSLALASSVSQVYDLNSKRGSSSQTALRHSCSRAAQSNVSQPYSPCSRRESSSLADSPCSRRESSSLAATSTVSQLPYSRRESFSLAATSAVSQLPYSRRESYSLAVTTAVSHLPNSRRESSSLAATSAVSHLPNSRRESSSLAATSAVSQLYYRILESLPGGIQLAFAYGSGVYKQDGHADMTQNMLDFIVVVDDPVTWHRENIKVNAHHYSHVRFLGSRAVARLQKYGAGVYFNTLVPFEDRLIKYGVISTERLISDLLDWDTLYISGRLHKPVKLLVLPQNSDLLSAMQMNLQSAVHAALLLLPEDFCEEAFYTTIAGLSYNGDFRMVIGEDKNKVSNIVRPNMAHFRRLYESILVNEEHVVWHQTQGRMEQNPSHITQFHHLQLLPKTVLMLLQEKRTRPGSHPDLEEVLKIYANSSHCDDSVAECISHIVWMSSLGESLKTVLTAGVRKSVVYSLQKLNKMIKGRPKKEDRV